MCRARNTVVRACSNKLNRKQIEVACGELLADLKSRTAF
jgi:hypothetical protein